MPWLGWWMCLSMEIMRIVNHVYHCKAQSENRIIKPFRDTTESVDLVDPITFVNIHAVSPLCPDFISNLQSISAKQNSGIFYKIETVRDTEKFENINKRRNVINRNFYKTTKVAISKLLTI